LTTGIYQPGKTTEGLKIAVKLPITLDVEASGFGSGSYPIEVGIALGDGTDHSWLIRPLRHWQHWCSQAQATHGISREQLHREGLEPARVAAELNELLRHRRAYSDAWGYDSTWLSRLFYDTGQQATFRLDTVHALLSDSDRQHWQMCRHAVLASSGLRPHRAGNDAAIIQQTLAMLTARPEISTTASTSSPLAANAA
jgi:hypothetical protein